MCTKAPYTLTTFDLGSQPKSIIAYLRIVFWLFTSDIALYVVSLARGSPTCIELISPVKRFVSVQVLLRYTCCRHITDSTTPLKTRERVLLNLMLLPSAYNILPPGPCLVDTITLMATISEEMLQLTLMVIHYI